MHRRRMVGEMSRPSRRIGSLRERLPGASEHRHVETRCPPAQASDASSSDPARRGCCQGTEIPIRPSNEGGPDGSSGNAVSERDAVATAYNAATSAACARRMQVRQPAVQRRHRSRPCVRPSTSRNGGSGTAGSEITNFRKNCAQTRAIDVARVRGQRAIADGTNKWPKSNGRFDDDGNRRSTASGSNRPRCAGRRRTAT